DQPVIEGHAQTVKHGIGFLGGEGEVHHAAAVGEFDIETLLQLADITREQQCRRVTQALIHLLDGQLLQIRIIHPDLLAFRDQQVYQRKVSVTEELPGKFKVQDTSSLLKNSPIATKGYLGEALDKGLNTGQQLIKQLCGMALII